jgi:hypothetical protein
MNDSLMQNLFHAHKSFTSESLEVWFTNQLWQQQVIPFLLCLQKFVALIILNPQQWKIGKKGEEICSNVSRIWVQQMNTHLAPAHNVMFVHGFFSFHLDTTCLGCSFFSQT